MAQRRPDHRPGGKLRDADGEELVEPEETMRGDVKAGDEIEDRQQGRHDKRSTCSADLERCFDSGVLGSCKAVRGEVCMSLIYGGETGIRNLALHCNPNNLLGRVATQTRPQLNSNNSKHPQPFAALLPCKIAVTCRHRPSTAQARKAAVFWRGCCATRALPISTPSYRPRFC